MKEKEKVLKQIYEQQIKSYEEIMRKIANEKSFETVDISGMGGSYEWGCQTMLRAGIKFLKEHPDFHFDYQGFKNVYGIVWTDTPWGKKLDKVLLGATAPDSPTGAMHQAVISHLMYIHKHGYEKWLEHFPKERRYIYPRDLPKPKQI